MENKSTSNVIDSREDVPTRSFGMFSNWIGGRMHNFHVDVETGPDTITFRDKGDVAGLNSGGIVFFALAACVCYGYVLATDGYSVPVQPVVIMIPLYLIFGYRAARAFSRKCSLSINLLTNEVELIESWPNRRNVRALLSECRWILQPVFVKSARFSSDYRILHVLVKGHWFSVGVDTSERSTLKGMPNAILERVQIERCSDWLWGVKFQL